jgi:hypothetical protein
MGQTPIYDQLRGERINADVPHTGGDPQLVGHPGEYPLLVGAPVSGGGVRSAADDADPGMHLRIEARRVAGPSNVHGIVHAAAGGAAVDGVSTETALIGLFAEGTLGTR